MAESFLLWLLSEAFQRDSVKSEHGSTMAPSWSSQMREPLSFAPRSFADGSEILSGIFFCEAPGERFRKKTEGLKQAVWPTARFSSAGARGQGERGSLWQS